MPDRNPNKTNVFYLCYSARQECRALQKNKKLCCLDNHSKLKTRSENLIMNPKIKQITKLSIIAALYVALCYAFAFMSYGLIQFRIAEILLILPFYNKKYCIPVILGTFIANSFNGIYDMVLGTFATLLVLLVVILIKSDFIKKIIITPAAAIINGVIIGLMLHYIFEVPNALWFCMVSVAIGEFAVVLAGVLAFAVIEKSNKKFINMLENV